MPSDNNAQGSGDGFSVLTQPGTNPKITSIFDFTDEVLEQLAFWLEQRGLNLPIVQLPGFSQFTAQTAVVVTSESTASAVLTDLATVGPQITGLSDGKYVVLWGSSCETSGAGTVAITNVQANSSVPSTDDQCENGSLVFAHVSRAALRTLAGGGNNTLTVKYQQGGGATGTHRRRWLTALRYANL